MPHAPHAVGRKKGATRLPIPWPILVLLLLVVGAAGYAILAPGARAAEHPAPRPGVSAAQVQPPERYAADPRVAEVYATVAQIPEVIDGIYCYCHCHSHSGHASLLTCFESDHSAGCDICLDEARIAYQMNRQGATLPQIRRVIDQQFGA